MELTQRQWRRQSGLRQWARRNKWGIDEAPTVGWGRRLPGGNSVGLSLVLRGVVDGRAVAVGEYGYQVSTRDFQRLQGRWPRPGSTRSAVRLIEESHLL